MKNKLVLIRNTVRLNCVWVPTGDVKKPLACVWVKAQKQQADSNAGAQDETVGVHLCA
jgi:hypothetical protein